MAVATSTTSTRFRRGSHGIARRVRDWTPAIAVAVGFILLWQGAVQLLDIQRFVLPAPFAIGQSFVEYFPEIWAAASYTAYEAVGGLVIGVTAGLLVGLITGRWVGLRESLLPFAIAVNSVPIIAFAPIMNNWFGLANPLSKMMIAALLVFFPVMINTVRGLISVDPSALELMRSTAATDFAVLTKLRIPTALPFIFTSLKIAATLATIGAIVGEYFGAPRASLGQYIVQHAAYFDFERSWAAIILAAAIGISLYVAVLIAERLVMPWHSSVRGVE
ncbi:MAG: NitT/TauT family transport system permease protein [Chloroflexota bacterium]|jgi:NitT/TauT family transport system permease protein|nr:NitT/TauT family transport system permease protein [Chloroflexota bacterium]